MKLVNKGRAKNANKRKPKNKAKQNEANKQNKHFCKIKMTNNDMQQQQL